MDNNSTTNKENNSDQNNMYGNYKKQLSEKVNKYDQLLVNLSLKEKLKNKVFEAEKRKLNRFPFLNISNQEKEKEKEYARIKKLRNKALKLREINKNNNFNNSIEIQKSKK